MLYHRTEPTSLEQSWWRPLTPTESRKKPANITRLTGSLTLRVPPHFGGVFEALIKSAKKAIKATLGDADVTDEELHTAICGAERLLNSRPITYVSSDPNDLSPLTPSHFLVGEIGGPFAPEALDHEQTYNPKKRWYRVQQLLGQFWKRWRKEFLPSLNLRKKWFHPRHNLKEGDVVLIVEPNASRGEWPLGRVIEAYRIFSIKRRTPIKRRVKTANF